MTARIMALSWDAFFRRVVVASLLLHLLVAYRSQGFYSCDEHYQTLEFMNFKLGGIAAGDLPWEFRAHIRPWLQPAFYLPFAKLFGLLGVEEPFRMAWLLRSVSGLLSWAALVAFGRCLPRLVLNEPIRRATLLAIHFFYLVPMLGVRTSSENFSQAFLLFGLALLIEPGRLGTSLHAGAGEQPGAANGRPARWSFLSVWLAGAALGLSFLARYQSAALVFGCCLWFLVYGRERRAFALNGGAAFVLVMALGAVLDRWGYGRWVYSPWDYFRVNLMEGVAARHGTLPPWGYLQLYATKIMPPFGVLWILVFVLAAWRLPRHVLTWTVLPFALMHHVISHKETRFLFPTLVLSVVLSGLLVERALEREGARPSWLARFGKPLVVGLLGFNLLGLLIYALVPTNPRWSILNELDRIAPRGYTLVTGNGYDAVTPCGARPAFYWGKRRWAPYSASEPARELDERGLPIFYAWAGTPRTLLESPFSRRCRELLPKFWVSGPEARSFWADGLPAKLARSITVYGIYACRQ
jgi:phosphatidylinositol glycan class B